jgi:Rieske 2Fe-2S family protein
MKSFVRPRAGAGAKTLEAEYYTSPEIFARELDRIFGREWIVVGREEQIAGMGTYVLADVAGESLIITRDRERTPRAYFNVCRHRGTRMCTEASGTFAGSIQCPYHAWTYGLDGALIAARNMDDIEDFDRADYPLREAAVATFDGFVLVNLAADPEPFERAFAPVIERFRKWSIGSLRTARSIKYELACNWKLVFQNYSECYHCPLVHPQLERLSPSESGRNDLTSGRFLGGFSELREAGTSLTTTGKTSRAPLGSVDGADLDRSYYYTLFPSMLLSLHRDYVMTHVLRPLASDRTEIVCAWLFAPELVANADFDASDVVDFWDLTNRQDWHVNELTQMGISSRAYSPGPYANAEGLLDAFDRHYREVIA